MTLPAVNSTSSTSSTSSSGATSQLAASTDPSSEDRFLKMLVAQMQNQDPLNPLDNAQVTSQMAQINTVTGIDKLNTSIGALSSQFVQLQAMQGAALVGHEVAVEGDTMRVRDGKADAGFELSTKADKVKVEVTTASGTVIDTLDLGAQDAGRHTFDWQVPAAYTGSDLHFKVTATSGATNVEALPLRIDTISAVSTFGNVFALELSKGDRVAYDAVWAFL